MTKLCVYKGRIALTSKPKQSYLSFICKVLGDLTCDKTLCIQGSNSTHFKTKTDASFVYMQSSGRFDM